MNSRSIRIAACAAAVVVVAGPLWAADAPVTKSKAASAASGNLAPAIEIEQRAIGILKGACDRLAAAKTLSFRAVTSEESPSRLGPPLTYFTTSEVTMARPDRLRVVSPGDGPRSEFYYDGKTMAAYSPGVNLLARSPAPPTIDAMLQAAYQKAEIFFPYDDLLITDPYKGISDGLRVAFYVGTSEAVGGVKTYVVAYANDHVFVQAWIGVDDRLPRRLQAVFRGDPLQLRHSVELSQWKLDAPVAAGTFALPARAAKALPIPFTSPNAVPEGGRESGAPHN
jgi:hypothetical protein